MNRMRKDRRYWSLTPAQKIIALSLAPLAIAVWKLKKRMEATP